jgi:hypothetical protein
MSEWPMRGHFRYLRFKTFPMTLRTPKCKVFWALLLSSKHSGVPEDSKCCNPTLAKCGGEAQHLQKLEAWSPPGLPNVQSSTARPKTPRIGMFLVSLERSWNVDIENGLALAIRTSAAQVMGKTKVENPPFFDVQIESATQRWKDLDESYNFDSRFVPIRV